MLLTVKYQADQWKNQSKLNFIFRVTKRTAKMDMASLLAAQQLLAGAGGQQLTASQQQQLVAVILIHHLFHDLPVFLPSLSVQSQLWTFAIV